MYKTLDVSTAHECVESELYFPDPLALNFTSRQRQNGFCSLTSRLSAPWHTGTKIFKRFASKKILGARYGTAPAPDAPTNHEQYASLKTLIMAAIVPTFPDNLKKDKLGKQGVPQQQGAERLLNRTSVRDRRRSHTLRVCARGCTKWLDPLACSEIRVCVYRTPPSMKTLAGEV